MSYVYNERSSELLVAHFWRAQGESAKVGFKNKYPNHSGSMAKYFEKLALIFVYCTKLLFTKGILHNGCPYGRGDW